MDCKVKEKIKALNIDEDLRDTLSKLLLNSEPENSCFKSDIAQDSSSDEDIRVLNNKKYISSYTKEECMPCQLEQPFSSNNKEEDEFYNIFSQFKDMNVNVLNGNNLMELLRMIKDPNTRS
ncbi:hypothetical protein RND71_023094 [Anisodus tanguticus]|uniref:Uncharacterized protein n=1 Tax=Anisodus tanguticus TaxID=243964 RepID=A0AAE1RUI0_9SOLA|nr:hypothetical protein RND71_023094 [Anisodus tanguticus]